MWHRDCVNRIGAHQMMGELVDSKFVLHGPHSVDDRWPPAQPFGKRVPHRRLDEGPTLIVISLLSLGLWAAIWGAVASLFSAAL
jgi:hypothetical protein